MRISTMPLSTPRNRSAGQTTGFAAMIACVLLLVGCGGGGGGNNAAVPPPPVGDPQFVSVELRPSPRAATVLLRSARYTSTPKSSRW